LINLLNTKLNEFLFEIILLLLMEVMQNEEPISDLGNRDEADSRRLWVTGSACGEPKPKQFFYSSCSPWCKEQQEKKRIAISEIVQILRTKL
jgi:hypothetical protein